MSNTKRRKSGSKSSSKASTKSRTAVVQQAQAERRDWKKFLWYGLGAAAIVALILGIVLNQPEDLEPPEGVQTFEPGIPDHITGPIAYPQDPPVGGPHNPVWQECGYYAQPINNENAVHALEHGAVWITYQPDLDVDSIDRLASFARDPEVLVSPYPGLDSAVVATTWTTQLRVDSADDPDLRAFLQNFKNVPGTPEPAAGCNDGRGTTALRGEGL